MRCEICKLEHLLKCTSNESIQNNVDELTKLDNNVVKIIEQNISNRESLGYKVKVCIGEDLMEEVSIYMKLFMHIVIYLLIYLNCGVPKVLS